MWSKNRLCPGLDNPDCDDPVGRSFGTSKFLDNEGIYETVEYYELYGYGTITLAGVETSEGPEVTSIVGGTGCFAHASGQTGYELVETDDGDEYYQYMLNGLMM